MATEAVVGEVPDTWEYTTLGEACSRGGGDIQTGPFGSQLHASDYVPDGIPSIMPQNIGDNRVIADGIARITKEDAERLGRYRVRPGDIVYSRRGDVERRALIGQTENGWLCGTGCLRIRFGDGHLSPTYASYYLGDLRVREWIVRHAHGATMPNLNTGILSDLPFVIPPIREQEAIGSVLGTLDQRIHLNQRMNETLEAIAQALYKSWFVDFDPVHAKSEGREPGLSKTIADLFPDAFDSGEFGGIPRGWQVRPIGDLATVTGGGTPSTKEGSYWEGGTHCWATPKDLSSLKTPVLLKTERRVTDAGLAQIASGLLPAGTVLMSSRAPIGYLAVAEVPVAINQGFIAMKAAPGVSNLFLLRWAEWAHDLIVSRANGSTFLEISKSNFRPIPVTTPPDRLMESFDAMVRPLHLRMVANEQSSKTLVDLRDALLPKLISGEIRITEVDRILGVRSTN